MDRVRLTVVEKSADTLRACARFCQRLNATTGLFFEPLVAHSYDELERQLVAGQAALAWSPPLVALDLQDRRVATALVALKRGLRAGYYSALITATTAPWTRVEELSAVRAAWVSGHSASGYLVPRWQLSSQGVNLRRTFVQESFWGTHERVAAAVINGDADVGATHVTVDPVERRLEWAPWLNLGPGSSNVRVLLLVGPIPSDVIVAHRDVSPTMRQRLTAAFLSLRADDEATHELFDATQFELVPSGHFSHLRRLAERGKGLQ